MSDIPLRKQEHPKGEVWPLFIVDKNGTKHEVNKVIYNPVDPATSHEVHVWCHSWYGHHIIGKDCEWAVRDESPAEQPVVDSELKQEVDHLEKKISMCEEALEKLHAERYETRLALRMLLKVFKNDQISKDQEKYYSQAETILEKHGKVTDALRTRAAEQPGREADITSLLQWLGDEGWKPQDDGTWFNFRTRSTFSLYELAQHYKNHHPTMGGI